MQGDIEIARAFALLKNHLVRGNERIPFNFQVEGQGLLFEIRAIGDLCNRYREYGLPRLDRDAFRTFEEGGIIDRP